MGAQFAPRTMSPPEASSGVLSRFPKFELILTSNISSKSPPARCFSAAPLFAAQRSRSHTLLNLSQDTSVQSCVPHSTPLVCDQPRYLLVQLVTRHAPCDIGGGKASLQSTCSGSAGLDLSLHYCQPIGSCPVVAFPSNRHIISAAVSCACRTRYRFGHSSSHCHSAVHVGRSTSI